MKKIAVFLFASLSVIASADNTDNAEPRREVTPETPALLCADQADNCIRLVDPLTPGDRKAVLWSYPADDETPFHYRPTDAKRVEIDGEVFVLAAYHGRVQLVRFRDHRLMKDFPTPSSCHSAELLPDGVIVSVNSNHGILRLHQSSDEFVDHDLPYAHGVTWDKADHCLWVLGDRLYRFNYAEGRLSLESTFPLPLSPTGHDLFPMRNESKLLVTNNEALFLFDTEKKTFETLSEMKQIKSASEHADGSIWVSEPKTIEGAKEWQSDAVVPVITKDLSERYTLEGARFYKARWWQRVTFSY